MEIKENYSFQVDSETVKKVYQDQDNYLIEYSEEVPKKYCIIYFSSNDIYYPNTENAFIEQLLGKNRFEWYKTRINYGHKHIFIRDIQKQWYLGGINSRIDTPEKLIAFLKNETKGYLVIAIGSSAGGFASIIYGQLLNAERIYSFNGQFEIRSILNSSTETIDPLIFRNKENEKLKNWYDSRNFISNPSIIYYFQSARSTWDIEQFEYVKDIPINHIKFHTSNHGIPFLKTNLPFVINQSQSALFQMTEKILYPISFSFKSIGIYQTILSLATIFKFGLNKIYIHTLLKVKS